MQSFYASMASLKSSSFSLPTPIPPKRIDRVQKIDFSSHIILERLMGFLRRKPLLLVLCLKKVGFAAQGKKKSIPEF